MRAAGLSRLSRETQETTSPERQRSLHLRLARNYELHYDPRPYADGGDLYEDIDFSAYNLRRPRPAFENLMRRLDQYDVGRSRQMESANISNRVKAAYEAIAQVGRWKGGTPPFGWQAAPHESGKGQRLELNPTEAEIVREAIDRVLSGESVRSICGDFTGRGIQTRRKEEQTGDYSTRWYGTSLRKLLRSPILIGQHVAGGTKEIDSSGRVLRVVAPRIVTDEHGIPIQSHEPLIDLQTYQRLQAELDNRRQHGRRRPNST